MSLHYEITRSQGLRRNKEAAWIQEGSARPARRVINRAVSHSWKRLSDVSMPSEKYRQVVALMFLDTPHGDYRSTGVSDST